MKLIVKMLAGKEIEVEVNRMGKMQDVKEYIYKTTGENVIRRTLWNCRMDKGFYTSNKCLEGIN